MKNLYRTALPLILAAVVLASVLCVGGIGATAADDTNSAPDADTPAFAMDSATALAGQTVTVPLRIVHNPGIIGMRAVVTYDPAVLTPIAMEAQDFVGATFGPLSNPLSVLWFDALNPDNTTDGVVALCTFTVAADAPAGEYPLQVSIADPDDNYNAAWQTVEFATIDGSVRVVDYVAGDANSDSKVNVRDLGIIQQYLNGWDVAVHLEASDVTGDGKVNVRDLGLLQQYLNGWDVTLEHGSGNTTSTTLPTAGPTTQPTTAPTQVQLPLVTDQKTILADAFALGSNETTPYIAQLTGKVTSIYKFYDAQRDSMSVYFSVGGQNTLCNYMRCGGISTVKVDDTITVTGVIRNNSARGEIEFDYHTASDTAVQLVDLISAQLPLVTDQDKILADAFALGPNETTPYIAQLTGKVTSIDQEYNAQYGTISVVISVGGKNILCYHMKGNGCDKVKPGDTITVTGVIKNFYYALSDTSGKVEFTYDAASNTEVQMIKRVAGVTPNPTLSIVANPQVGVAYKFGLFSTYRNATYYAIGGMSGYYMATSTSAASAIDVYLENADGGYYLYTMVDGKKQYMNLELSGTHINAVYRDTASTVFTYNTSLKTLVTTINHPDKGEGVYAFSTYGSYVTIGAYITSRADAYFCHFYA